MLTLSNDEDIKTVFGIEYLYHMKVKIEAIRSSKLIPQCKKCQRYGHTQKFCAREPKCVKYADYHLTVNCRRPVDAKPGCSNCGKGHPANYRGCEVAKELQKGRDMTTKTKLPRQFTSTRTSGAMSYAQATQGSFSQPKQNQNEQQ